MTGGDGFPLVTVVLTCGPDTGAVERSLRSLRAQTIQSFEIVTINLGCPPAFFSTLTGQASGERIRAIEGGEGLAAAWNLAAAQSRAPYLCFLDPGDEIDSTGLEECLFLLETASLDVCASWETRGAGLQKTGPFSLGILLGRNAGGFAVMRKETLTRAGGFDRAVEPPSLIGDLWIRMAEGGARGRVLHSPLVRNAAEPRDDRAYPALVARKYDRLRNQPGLVRRLDGLRAGTTPPQSYARLLDDAHAAHPPAILVTMPYLVVGGAERSMAGLLGELSRCGFRVLLVTTEAAPEGWGDASHWFSGNVAGLYRLPEFIEPGLRLAFVSYLIQRHSVQLLWQAGSPSLYRWLPRLKGLFAELAVVDLLFNPVGHGESFLGRSTLIDHVLVEHEGMAAWVAEQGGRETRVSVIPNAADIARFAPLPPRDWRTGGPRRPDTFVAGFFGRLSDEKAPDTFLRIAERFRHRPSFQFLIGGTGPLEDSLRSRCWQRGLEESVHFLGLVDTREYLPCCDVAVVCSRLDGRPNIVAESLAMGVPVVASRVGGIPEMVPAGHGAMLFAPDDVDGFCGAIERLATDREGHLQLAAAGRRWMEEQHSLPHAAAECARLFRSLAETHARPARTATEQADIVATVLPPVRQRRPLAPSRLGAALSIVRHALSPSNALGTLRTLRCCAGLRRDPAAVRRFARLFNREFYAWHRPDVAAARIPPLWHYLLMGFREGANPSRRFDTDYYLGMYPDIAGAGINPLVHYVETGHAEGRGCLPPWD